MSMVKVEKDKNSIKIRPLKRRSFLDLYGAVKIKKPVNFKKLRKQFEKEITGKTNETFFY